MTEAGLTSIDSGFHIGQVYARALFSLAAEQNVVDDVKTELDALTVFAAEQEEFLSFLSSPYFNTESKKGLIEKVFADRLTKLTANFLFIVIKNDRAAYLPYMIDRYTQLWLENYHCYKVIATVSEPLSDERIRNLSHQIAASIKNNVELKVTVDPSIIGGIIIRYNENIIDNSVRRRLVNAIKTIKANCRERGQFDEI
jgi:F-type H+-transporting ATPase subunit delta